MSPFIPSTGHAVDATVKAHKLITADPNKYILFKQVIVAGLPGTGTDGVAAALKKLGFIVYDAAEAAKNHDRDFALWVEAAEAKKAGTPYGRNEFDKLTGRYNSLVGAPAAFFMEDLVKAYPDTKIILVTTDTNSFAKNIKKSIFFYADSTFSPLKLLVHYEPSFYGLISSFLQTCVKPFFGGSFTPATAKIAYTQHINSIRAAVPSKRLLEIDQLKSWDSLCAFVGKPIPSEPIPSSH
ncbi:uncharacterized protein BDR25DRAFT_223057, partial [Lindgomyces ingoldianus]